MGHGSPCGSRTFAAPFLFLAPPPRSLFALSTPTMLWPRNAIAPLICSDGYMHTWAQHEVDFIGGDFNMSACSTVGDVFADPEFSAPGNSLLWCLGALGDSDRECTGFLILHKHPCEWRVDSHGCYKFNNLALGPRDTTVHFPVFFYICAPPTFWALTVLRAANKPSRGAWNVKPPSMNVDKASGISHNPQRPDVLVPLLLENTVRAVSVWRLLP